MSASFPRFAVRTALVLAVVCALGIWPMERLKSSQGVVAWAVALGLVFVGALAGFWPMTTKFARSAPEAPAQAWLVGLGLRMLVVLSGCVAVWSTRALATEPFLIGAGVGYAVVLAFEIRSIAREASVGMPSGAAVPLSTAASKEP